MTAREQIYELASGILNAPKSRLRGDAPIEEYAVDSLDFVEFVFAVQEQLGVNFETNEFDQIKSLNDLVRAVEAKQPTRKREDARSSSG